MSRDFSKRIIVGLDIGSSNVVAVVAESLPEEGRFEVIGLGESQSRGMRQGAIVNIDQTIDSIQRALEEAELMADCNIREAYVGISGSHITSINSTGMVAVGNEVTDADIQRVIETAQAINIPSDNQVLHVITQHFSLDKQHGIIQPKGMAGMRLEVHVHIVTGSQSVAQNIIKCVRRCNLQVNDLILQQLAASQVCLAADEKDIGVVLIDIGSGTTGVALFHGGCIQHTDVIPYGGDRITLDIASMFRISTVDAEDIKMMYGVAKYTLVDPEECFEIQGLGDRDSRTVKRHELSEVIEARVAEILMSVKSSIAESGLAEKISGYVLTGGGAMLPGMVEVAEEVFNQPVRVGAPLYEGALADKVCTPRHSTVMGLVMEGRLQQDKEVYETSSRNALDAIVDFFRRLF